MSDNNKLQVNFDVRLLNFQNEILNKMISIDQSFETKIIFNNKYIFKPSIGFLNLNVGDGKTVVACRRIKHWFDHILCKREIKDKHVNSHNLLGSDNHEIDLEYKKIAKTENMVLFIHRFQIDSGLRKAIR